MSTSRYLTKMAAVVYGALLVVVATPADAALSLSNTPLFLTVTMPPNITLTLDDSGSMSRAWVPEICAGTGDIRDCTTLDNRYAKSSAYNLLYYNPAVKYPTPKKYDGSDWTTAFTSAYRNGFDTSFSTAQNLTTRYRPSASLYLQPGGTPSEEYMGHYKDDSGCTTSSPYVCRIKDGDGKWYNGPTACTGNNSSQRDASCRGEGDGVVPPRMPAYYYNFNKGLSGCSAGVTDNKCYALVVVSDKSGAGTADLNGNGKIDSGDKDERQNFANWYSFARTRNLATITAASVSFSDLDDQARVAWQGLNTCRGGTGTLLTSDCKGWKQDTDKVSNSIGTFGVGNQKKDFYTWLAQLPTNDGTPLPAAMNRVGKYYQVKDNGGPYDNNPESNLDNSQHACRRNYHIMMTDGIWNDGISDYGNADNKNRKLGNELDAGAAIKDYFAQAPYKDAYSNTLADVAFNFWASDLNNSLKNILAPVVNDRSGSTEATRFWNARNDPATWQHMVNFTIGLGLTGYLANEGFTWQGNTFTGSFPAIAANKKDWPDANSKDQNEANVADLWHAAINSRGLFFSADDPASLSASFASALTAITGSNGSSAALSANSTSARTEGTFVYQAKFNRDWSGTLLALPVNEDGVVLDKKWDAGELIPSWKERRIFTRDDKAGVEFFACDKLSTALRGFLNTSSTGTEDKLCQKRLDWLRGDTANEQRNTDGVLRNRPPSDESPTRTKVMGDVINSDPAYVEVADQGYSMLPAGTPGQADYAGFLSGIKGRPAMVYVGANDGLVHGILASSGVEQFAYVPVGVNATIARLTDPDYTHKYYVDGGITTSDAVVDGKWRTLILGGLNAGGKSIYALDVTDPTTFGASNALWEFTDADMGLSFSQPQVGVTESGDWVAVFGNGYNSTKGNAYLFIVNLTTGETLRKFALGSETDNGLSTAVLVDKDDNHRIDTIYAGDLRGNLWKVDTSGKTSGDWNVGIGGKPLFTAEFYDTTDKVYVRQPITSQPKVAGNSLGGHMVVFGTGRYLAVSDVFDKHAQTYYGIRDFKDSQVAGRGELQAQTITLQKLESGATIRTVSGNTVDYESKKGWYLDLLDPPSATKNGERVTSTSLIKYGRAIFVTVIPSTDPCVPGGTSWLMELELQNGGTFSKSILDVNSDGKINDADLTKDGSKVVSGMLLEGLGISKTPIWLDCKDKGCKVLTGTSGGFATKLNEKPNPPPEETAVPVQRRSWIQIR